MKRIVPILHLVAIIVVVLAVCDVATGIIFGKPPILFNKAKAKKIVIESFSHLSPFSPRETI